jgi:hypothetical protein
VAIAIVVGMPGPLRNARRELFAQAIVRGAKDGVNLTRAYAKAGYVGQGHVAEVGGSRLMSCDEVRMRVSELTAPATRKTGRNLEALFIEAERILRDAEADKQHSVRLQALALILRIHELVLDHAEPEIEISGGAKTAAEIQDMLVTQIVDELGVDAAVGIADAIVARVADQAVPVSV